MDADLAWLAGELEFGRTVAAWVPGGFAACARVLHPAHGPDGAPVRWATVAAWSGRPLEATAFFEHLERRPDGTAWSDRPGAARPDAGRLADEHLDRLRGLLAAATETPQRIRQLTWSGYGTGRALYRRRRWPRRRPRWRRLRVEIDDVEVSPSLTGSGRRYVPSEAPLGEVGSAEHPPSFWWPADRAWFVATDIDIHSTYVAGAADLVERVLADDLLEAFPAGRSDPIDGAPIL